MAASNLTAASNITEENIPEVFPEYAEIIIRAVYCLITFTGILGNGAVFFLIVTKKVEHTAFNLLLANLSLADLLANVSLYPYIFIDLQKSYDITSLTGAVLCNFTIGLTVFFVCTSVSFLTLTTISLNRYICINHPFRFEWQQSKRTVKILICVTWILGVIFISPNFFSFTYLKKWGICRRAWPSAINGAAYSLTTSFLALIVPSAVLVYTFIATLKNLRTKVSDISIISSTQNSRKKTIRLLGWLIIVFFVCWTPFYVYWFLSRSTTVFARGNIGDYQRMRVIRLTILVACLSASADPLLYALFSEQYRGALRKMFQGDAESSIRLNLTTTSNVATFPTRMRTITFSERSSFSMHALDEEFRGKMTPKSSIVMAHIRGSPNPSKYAQDEQ